MILEDIPNTEQFLAICYKCGLTNDDLEHMTYGDCVDYINAYVELHEEKPMQEAREATQEDIDRFFG